MDRPVQKQLPGSGLRPPSPASLPGFEPKPLERILQRIGNTPLVEIKRLWRNPNVRIFAKCEWFNPGGSVKDRPALNMILEAERSGLLTPQKVVLDATSGNTGIAFAMIGAVRGYAVHLAIPANAGRERFRILEGYGAGLIRTDPLKGTDGAIEEIMNRYAEAPERYFYANQYGNPANWRAHFQGTAEEIFSQTDGRLTHFVAGLGTTGTFIGTSRGLKSRNPGIRCVSFMPATPLHGLEGLKHLPSARVPAIYDPLVADQHLEISTEEAQEMVRRLAREEGLLVGPSSGAAMVAAMRVAGELEQGVIATLFPDSGTRYLSEAFW